MITVRPCYTVAVGKNWHPSDGSPAPDYTCGHKHKTLFAAKKCGEKLYDSKIVRGKWQANLTWHGNYIIGADGHKVYSQ